MAKAKKEQVTEIREELVEVSRREQRLRERLLTIDEDMIHDERRVHENGERRRERLTRRINKVRSRQEVKLDRLENSRLYKKSKILYAILSPFFAIGRGVRSIWRKIRGRVDHHKKVTPHRSFYLTTHAQAVRQINISGYLRFVHEVGRLIWDNKWLYFKALLLLTLALLVVIGLGKQSNYNDVREALDAVGLNWFTQTVGLVTQAVITSLTISDANKQMLATVIFIVAWLVLTCLVRHIYGGRTKIKLRDALYNGTGSIVQMFILLFILLVQTLPLAIAMISYSAITGAGYINTGIKIENMAAWCAICTRTSCQARGFCGQNAPGSPRIRPGDRVCDMLLLPQWAARSATSLARVQRSVFLYPHTVIYCLSVPNPLHLGINISACLHISALVQFASICAKNSTT